MYVYVCMQVCMHVILSVCMYVCEAYLQEDQQSVNVVVQKIQSFLKKILPLTHTYMLHDQPPIPQYYVRMLADITNISHQLARCPFIYFFIICMTDCMYVYVCMYVFVQLPVGRVFFSGCLAFVNQFVNARSR